MLDEKDVPQDSYPITSRNRVKRVHERGHYDRASVYGILDSAVYCHVSYVIDGQPFCTPTAHWRKGDILYWHGSSASRMLRHLKVGTPACLTVSHIDSLVLARCGFNHSVDYRAAMCFGTAYLIDDPDEKVEEMRAIVDRFYDGRAEELRQPTEQETKATTIVKMHIDDASAKIRSKGLGDDEEDYVHPVWAGTIKLRTVIGETTDCPRLLDGITRPESVARYQSGKLLDDVLLESQRIYEEDLVRRGL